MKPKFKAGYLVRYNHAKDYPGFKFSNLWDRGTVHVRDNEIFLVIKADPNKIVYFNNVGDPRFAYTIIMVSVIDTEDRQRNKLLVGQIFEVVLDEYDEYLTLLASV